MGNEVFSNFLSNSNSRLNSYPHFSDTGKNKNKTVSDKKSRLKSALNIAKKAAPVVIPLAAIPAAAIITYKVSAKNFNGLKKSIGDLNNEVKNITRDMAKLEALQDAKNTLVNQTINDIL